MKKYLCVLLILCMFIPTCFAENAKVSDATLDSMTLEELNDLKTRVEKRITAKKASAADSADFTGIWQLKYFVDEFKQPTDQAYISNQLVEGTFSNSAATNKMVQARFLVQRYKGKPWVELMLYEYGNYQVKNSGSKSVNYKVIMKDSKGKKTTMTATIYSNGDRLTFTEADAQTIVDAFSQNGSVSFYVEENSKYGYNDNYTFTIKDTSGFANAFKQVK